MRKPEKALLMLLVLTLAICLPGCRLAQEEKPAPAQDLVIGVLITTEHIDLFDQDAYLNDHIDELLSGKALSGDASAYNERLYADVVPSERFADSVDFVFPGVEGFALYQARVQREIEGRLETYNELYADDAIVCGPLNIRSSDTEEAFELSGTLYLTADALLSRDGFTCYVNPVYQSADGRVYLQSGMGTGHSYDAPDIAEGQLTATTLKGSQSVTLDGITKVNTSQVTLQVSVLFRPERIDLIQFDEASQILRRDQYAPDQIPEQLALDPNAAYLIVETHKLTPAKEPVVTRELYTPDAGFFTTFSAQENGLCLQSITEILPG